MPPKKSTRKSSKKGGDILDDIGRVANIGMSVGMPIAHLLMGMSCHIHRLEKHLGLHHHMVGVDKHGSGLLGDVLNVVGLGDDVAGADDVAGNEHIDPMQESQFGGDYTTGGAYMTAGSRNVGVKELKQLHKNGGMQKVLTLHDLRPHAC